MFAQKMDPLFLKTATVGLPDLDGPRFYPDYPTKEEYERMKRHEGDYE
jgi:hypothetical protein